MPHQPIASPTDQADDYDGSYHVYAKWIADVACATNAPYTINHANGSSTVNANQQTDHWQFKLLGTYTFNAGTTTIALSDQADGYVIAGAIQIVPTDAQPNSFTWTPQITQAAEYTISAQWTTGPRHARNVPYTIHHVHGVSTHTVDQQQNGGTYQVLGTYTLDANSHITLTDQAGDYDGSYGVIIADAIKIEQTANPPGTTQPDIHYIHSDHLNTPQRITNTAQQTVWAADYQPFGEASITTASITNPLRFPGQYYDEETNLHYNYFRDYDPTTGRYIQSDPLGILLETNNYQRLLAAEMGIPLLEAPEGFVNHNYGYVGQNPLIGIDPTGEYGWVTYAAVAYAAYSTYTTLSDFHDCVEQDCQDTEGECEGDTRNDALCRRDCFFDNIFGAKKGKKGPRTKL